jgi:hypothetical protein
MWRTGLAIVAGLAAWFVIVTLLNFGLRALLPGYHSAEATLQFTFAMKAGRLVEAALGSLVAGAVVGLVAPSSRWAAWIAGLVLLALFVPVHIGIWNKLPAWYHLTFLVTLAPLLALGTLIPLQLRSERTPAAA